MRLLIAEDDKTTADTLARRLRDEHYAVDVCYDGDEAWAYLGSAEYDVAVLDIMMPGMDGLTLIRKMRGSGMDTPVLLLTARDAVTDRVEGLNAGADDYLTKPFHPMELVARIKAQLRRASQFGRPSGMEEIILKDLVLNITQHRLTQNEREIRLTPKEFGILEMLMRHPGRVFSSEQIFEAVWGEKAYDQDNTVMVHIRKLRDKLRDDSRRPRYIRTVWGVGYSFEK